MALPVWDTETFASHNSVSGHFYDPPAEADYSIKDSQLQLETKQFFLEHILRLHLNVFN